jgi:hypothetical protein
MLQEAFCFLLEQTDQFDALPYKRTDDFLFCSSNISLGSLLSTFLPRMHGLDCYIYNITQPLQNFEGEYITQSILKTSPKQLTKIKEDLDLSFSCFVPDIDRREIIDAIQTKSRFLKLHPFHEKIHMDKDQKRIVMLFSQEDLLKKAIGAYFRGILFEIVRANVSYINHRVLEEILSLTDRVGFNFSMNRDVIKKTKTYEVTLHLGTKIWNDFIPKMPDLKVDKLILYYDRTSGIWELLK